MEINVRFQMELAAKAKARGLGIEESVQELLAQLHLKRMTMLKPIR